MILRLVFENLKHRPVRTLLSAVIIGVQVTMILTLVGVSRGVLGDMAARNKATGADILVRPPDSSAITFNLNMPEGIVDLIRQQPHVVLATGTFVQNLGNFESITGINPSEFDAMSGGLRYMKGGQFQKEGDLVIDEIFARAHNLKPGDHVELGHQWRVTGIVEQGKLSRTFTEIRGLQDMYSAHGKISVVWVKLDDKAHVPAVIAALKEKLEDYKVDSVEDFISQFSVNSVPILERFTRVVIGIAVFVGFLAVLLTMYVTVLERTREIGILKALGASPGYIMGMLLREASLLALIGTLAGIGMAYGTRALLGIFAPTFPQIIVPDWYPWATLIALSAALMGAIYPGMKAAHQDAIEALAYD